MTIQEQTSKLLGKVDFNKTNSFTQAFLDYINQKSELNQFYNRFPSAEALREQAESRNFSSETREITASVIQEQYEHTPASDLTLENISLIKSSKTFTITTGHQLNIFTGPLYFIYKIVTVINTCKKLKSLYPDYNFVPVYWMASEDHDFDEINHFRFGGKKFSWDTDQTGAVGRIDPSSMKGIFDEIEMPGFFKTAYLKHDNLADAARHYVNALFGHEGIVVIDADSRALKSVFQPVIEEDIFKNTPHKLVNQTNESLEALGYKTQVYPREINFFYLKENLRSRLIKEDDHYVVLDTDIRFSATELQHEIQSNPERFSPNVVLRPLYQETILPNLAYVGGPSELVYWFQLKNVFSHFNTDFPILLPRSFAAVLTQNVLGKIEKERFSLEDLFKPQEVLIKEKIKLNTQKDLELKNHLETIQTIYSSIQKQSKAVDLTLEKLVGAEQRKAEKSIEKIERKMLKAEKRNQETLVNRIHEIKEALFPNGGLQERKDNFLNFYLADDSFIETCLDSFDPLDLRFHLIISDN